MTNFSPFFEGSGGFTLSTGLGFSFLSGAGLAAQSHPELKRRASEKARQIRRELLTFDFINPPRCKKIPPLSWLKEKREKEINEKRESLSFRYLFEGRL
jgi:hypothetical protein